MSTNVHVEYLDGPPFVHGDMIFFLFNSSNMLKNFLSKDKTLLSIILVIVQFEKLYYLLRGVKQGKYKWYQRGKVVNPRGQCIHGTLNVNQCPPDIDTWSKKGTILSTQFVNAPLPPASTTLKKARVFLWENWEIVGH